MPVRRRDPPDLGGAALTAGQAWLLARRWRVTVATASAGAWCLLLTAVGGPGVALPSGPLIAPVWLFAIVGTTLAAVPIVSASPALVERQAVRGRRGLGAGRVAAYALVVGVCLALFAGGTGTRAFVVMALCWALLSMLVAVVLGDAAVVVLVACGLALIFCSTRLWFQTLVLRVGDEVWAVPAAGACAVLAALVAARWCSSTAGLR